MPAALFEASELDMRGFGCAVTFSFAFRLAECLVSLWLSLEMSAVDNFFEFPAEFSELSLSNGSRPSLSAVSGWVPRNVQKERVIRFDDSVDPFKQQFAELGPEITLGLRGGLPACTTSFACQVQARGEPLPGKTAGAHAACPISGLGLFFWCSGQRRTIGLQWAI